MEIERTIDQMSRGMVRDLKRLVSIRSVEAKGEGGYPFGTGVHSCLMECMAIAEELGFAPVNMDNMLGYCEYGEGEEMVAVLGHLDIVPEGDGWSFPPFEGREDSGRLYGRGTIDNKGPVIAAMYALKAVRESGLSLGRRVRIIFGLNEETGSADMKYYLAKGGEVPVMGFTPDGEFPLINGEKGIVNLIYTKTFPAEEERWSAASILEIHAGSAVNVVPERAEAVVMQNGQTGRITGEGISAHASTPDKGENAIGSLIALLDELPIEGEMKRSIHLLNRVIGREWDGSSAGIKMQDEASGPLTLNLGWLHFDGTELRLGINLRYPVTKSYEDCIPALERQMHEAGFITAELIHKKSLYMPPDAPLVELLCSVYEEQTGWPAVPKCIGGGTYAKMMPGILAFGPVFPGDVICEHEPDEYVEIDNLKKIAVIMAHAMIRMAGEGKKE